MLLTQAQSSSTTVVHEPQTGHQPLAHSRACSTLQVQKLIKHAQEISPNNHSAQRKNRFKCSAAGSLFPGALHIALLQTPSPCPTTRTHSLYVLKSAATERTGLIVCIRMGTEKFLRANPIRMRIPTATSCSPSLSSPAGKCTQLYRPDLALT